MTIEPIPMTQKDTWVLSEKDCCPYKGECTLELCSKKCIFRKINARKALFKKRFPGIYGSVIDRQRKASREAKAVQLKALAREAKIGIDLASGKITDGDLSQQIQIIKDLVRTL